MDSNYCVCVSQYMRQLESLANTLLGVSILINKS